MADVVPWWVVKKIVPVCGRIWRRALLILDADPSSEAEGRTLRPPAPASLLWLQERVVCVRRGGHDSLPKYLRTVFLVLGPEPRLLGQALAASITLVSHGRASRLRTQGGEAGGGRSLAHPTWGMGPIEEQ